jgi:PKD repeat protein
MKNLLIATAISLFFLSQTGCKKIIDDAISCTTESFFLYIEGDVDANNLKLFHFTFVNSDTSGDYTLDNQIKWDFGDGVTETSQGLTIDHTYASTGSYTAKASYTLHKGSSSCSSYKEKAINVN